MHEVSTENAPSLPASRAFVIQFRATADIAHGQVEGRVEHMVSGKSGHFHSLTELMDFWSRIMEESTETSTADASNKGCS